MVIFLRDSVLRGAKLIDYKSNLLKFVNSIIELPRNPKQCAELITRARALLGRRSNQEIEIIDDNITCIIDTFTSELKAQHGGNYNRHMATVLKLDIHNKKDLLKYCLFDYDYPNIGNIKAAATMCDYFAIFSVRYVAIAHLTATSSPPKGLDESGVVTFRTEQIQKSCDFIYSACECINYAEQLSHTEKMIMKIDVLEFENKQLKDNHNLEIEKAGKKAISKKASNAGKKAHKEDYIDENTVHKWLSDALKEDPDYFIKYKAEEIARIIDRAGVVAVVQRTISRYVGNYKKEKLLKKAS